MKLSSVKFTIGVGKTKNGDNMAGPDGSHPQKDSIADLAIKAVCLQCAKYFGGYTKTLAYGGWVDKSGDLIEEPAVVIEAALVGGLRYSLQEDWRRAVREIVEDSKRILDQECILVQYIAGNSELA